MNKEELKEKEEAKIELRDLFKQAGYLAYTKLDHVSRSGMMRHISVFLMIDNSPYNINYLIAKLGDYKRINNGSLKTTGCGMDMGFDMVYNTSSEVYSTQEERDATKIRTHRNGMKGYETDGGYIVSQKWL